MTAHLKQLATKTLCQVGTVPRFFIRDDDDMCSHQRDVGAPEAMDDADRQHAVLSFELAHARHKALHRFTLSLENIGHATVEHRGHRTHFLPGRAQQKVHQLATALPDISVRVLSVTHQDRILVHGLRQMTMGIEQTANHHVGSDDGPNSGNNVAFAVVIALRNHAAVHIQGHDVDSTCRA